MCYFLCNFSLFLSYLYHCRNTLIWTPRGHFVLPTFKKFLARDSIDISCSSDRFIRKIPALNRLDEWLVSLDKNIPITDGSTNRSRITRLSLGTSARSYYNEEHPGWSPRQTVNLLHSASSTRQISAKMKETRYN